MPRPRVTLPAPDEQVRLLRASSAALAEEPGSYCRLSLGTQGLRSRPAPRCQHGEGPEWSEVLLLCWDGRDALRVEVWAQREGWGATDVPLAAAAPLLLSGLAPAAPAHLAIDLHGGHGGGGGSGATAAAEPQEWRACMLQTRSRRPSFEARAAQQRTAAAEAARRAQGWWGRCAAAMQRCLGPPGAVEGWVEVEVTFEPLVQ